MSIEVACIRQNCCIYFAKVKEGPVYREKLPERLTIFGISYLPAYYFRIFDELSRYLEINFFYFNPSPEFWADIHSEKESARIVRQSSWEISADDEISISTQAILSWLRGEQRERIFSGCLRIFPLKVKNCLSNPRKTICFQPSNPIFIIYATGDVRI